MTELIRYGPKILAFWRKAVEAEVKIECKDRAAATTLRHRLYKFRAQLRKEKHDLVGLADRVVLRIEPFFLPNGTQRWLLIATHVDRQYDELFETFPLEAAPTLPDSFD